MPTAIGLIGEEFVLEDGRLGGGRQVNKNRVKRFSQKVMITSIHTHLYLSLQSSKRSTAKG